MNDFRKLINLTESYTSESSNQTKKIEEGFTDWLKGALGINDEQAKKIAGGRGIFAEEDYCLHECRRDLSDDRWSDPCRR